MDMWSMPTTLETARGMGSSWRAGFLWSQWPRCRIVSPPSRMGKSGDAAMSSISKTFGALALASVALLAGEALAGTIEQIRDTKTLRIAYDPDAPPFSYIAPGSPAG